MRRNLIIIAICGVGVAPVLLRGLKVPSGHPQVFQEDVISWRMVSLGASAEVGAQLRSSVFAVGPAFDAVRLERSYPTGSANCGNFPPPVLSDDGITRTWSYTMQRPAAGACAVRGGADFVAVGVKGGTELRAQSAP